MIFYIGQFCVHLLIHFKFLGLVIVNSLSWKAHIDQMMSKLNTACFAIQTISNNVSRNFKNGLFCIHTFNYELWDNLGGNQPYSYKIFKIQKRVIKIIANSRMRDSCRELLKNLKYCTYILNISSHYQYL